MIIGFLGKGGSGKTTLSSAFALYLAQENFVLAVDADHNMDMTYNLEAPERMSYIGQAIKDIHSYLGVGNYKESFEGDKEPEFSLSPLDTITELYSTLITPTLRVMSTGPHTDDILYDRTCSHSLMTPLKIYLPFLKLKEKEYVVVDEKAGTDGVGTGITTGFNAAVVVAEPTVHGLKAATQIIQLLKFYNTPYFIALNKVQKDEDIALCKEKFGREPDFIFKTDTETQRFGKHVSSIYKDEFAKLKKSLDVVRDTRIERTKKKFADNKAHTK